MNLGAVCARTASGVIPVRFAVQLFVCADRTAVKDADFGEGESEQVDMCGFWICAVLLGIVSDAAEE
jgi:hypothetical protein